jgi:methyltransferase family protein
MLSNLWRLFSRGRAASREKQPVANDVRLDFPAEAKRAENRDTDWLFPPKNLLDVSAWDRFWTEQVRHGLGPPMFDFLHNDAYLVGMLWLEGMTSILCAGNGISQGPRALAQAGFNVVALDLSPRATEIAQAFDFSDETFSHFCSPNQRRCNGGRIQFVTGNILDPAICPGPFDVVIERCTAQLYLNQDIGGIMVALSRRLGPEGIFVSHCHSGSWKPPAERPYFTRPWFQQNQWTIWNGGPGRKPPGRVACLSTSTG